MALPAGVKDDAIAVEPQLSALRVRQDEIAAILRDRLENARED